MNDTVVFITALRLECDAVTAYLEGKTEYKTSDGTVYETGEYLTPEGKHWKIFVVESCH